MAAQENRKVKTLQKSYFDVLGICCPSEVPLIESILNSLDGVKEFSVIVPSRTVIVVHDSLQISQLQIVKALNQARLEANVRVYGEASFKKKWPSPFAVVSGALLALSFLKYVYSPFKWLAVAAVAAGIFPIVSKAFASIRRFRLDINILALIAVMGTIAMKDYTEAGTIVFLFTIAEWLESRAGHKASAVMLSLMSLAPQKAVLAETGEEVEVSSVSLNTVISVKAGETVPIDGVVVDGNCEIDEKTLTGEPFPVSKQKDSTVWAGTINLNGYVTVRTTALAEDCVVAKMTKLVEEAQNSKTRTQRFIDRCSQYYTPAIVIVSASLAVVPVAVRVRNPTHWFHLALVVLVSACPCGLVLSTPVATFCALTKAATAGILIKGGDYLETLAKIKIAAFDKTGTITRGEFVVSDFQSLCHDFSLKSLLYWVSSIESKSSHPMASTLVDYAKSESVEPKPENVDDYLNFPGEGISGKIDGRDVYIGNKRIARRAGCSQVLNLDAGIKGGKTVGYIFVEDKLAGVFSLSDNCRSGVAQALKELKSMSIKTAMLTGDNQAAAMHAQEQLGNVLEVVHSELLPEDKARIITEFKKQGRAAMVGDGLNDAPALATADIGISMGVSGSALATETGHIILMSNDIRKIPKAIKLARKAHSKVIENVFLSILIKGGILALAFSGYPLVWAAVLADVGTCLLVILNSMLLLREKHKPADECHRTSAHGLNKQKTKNGENLEDPDLEAGLLRQTNTRNCNSGCCGKKHEHKIQAPKVKNTGNCKSGCCANKNQQVEESTIKQKCCKKTSDSARAMEIKSDGDCNSGCCGEKRVQEKKHGSTKGCCEKPSDSDRGMQVKSDGDCDSGCCGEKIVQDKKHGSTKACCEKPSNMDRGLLMKSTAGSCKHSCCGDQQGKEMIKGQSYPEKQSCCHKPADSEITLEVNNSEKCSSGCYGNDEQAKEKKPKQIHCAEGAESALESELPQVKNGGNCKSSCCTKTTTAEEEEQEAVLEVKIDVHSKSGCCSKPAEASIGLPQGKNDESCKSSCCGDEEEEEAKEHGCGERRQHGGGCCRSYVKECCGDRRTGGSGFGGLAEIVIE